MLDTITLFVIIAPLVDRKNPASPLFEILYAWSVAGWAVPLYDVSKYRVGQKRTMTHEQHYSFSASQTDTQQTSQSAYFWERKPPTHISNVVCLPATHRKSADKAREA